MAENMTLDVGTGYGRKKPSHDARLTEVGPGTPMGEVMRRYWHPVASSEMLTSDVPHRTRVLGEDLIVFRDRQGRPGVVAERCAHRGSSLFYGRIEEDGIRCCYHGWKFDVQGRCIEQACEPARRRHASSVRQPWYPVEERYGLLFVYMGPADRKPALPRYEALEIVAEGEAYRTSFPGMTTTGALAEFNWLQAYENAVDPVHASWLHYAHSGVQFAGVGTTGFPDNYFDPYTVGDRVTYHRSEFGVYYTQTFVDYPEKGGREAYYRTEAQVPNVLALAAFDNLVPDDRPGIMMVWIVPCDDTSYRAFLTGLSPDPDFLNRITAGITQNGKYPWEMTDQELQRYPGDVEAQLSQGPITLHSEEHLVSSDLGVVMLRRLLKSITDDVEAGNDALGARACDDKPRPVQSGAFYKEINQAAE